MDRHYEQGNQENNLQGTVMIKSQLLEGRLAITQDKILTRRPVPERAISANPGLKFALFFLYMYSFSLVKCPLLAEGFPLLDILLTR